MPMQPPILSWLGPTPCYEECSDIGQDDFKRLNRLECRTFLAQLSRLFPIPAELEGKVQYGIQVETHDYGQYREVVLRGLGHIAQVATFTAHVESHAPMNWDHTAKVDLALGWGYEPRYCHASMELDLEGTVTQALVNASPQADPIPFDPLNEGQSNGQSPLLNAAGNPYRKILIPPRLIEQQVSNYVSHGHLVHGADGWAEAYLQLVDSIITVRE
jgi:hypothetical protein